MWLCASTSITQVHPSGVVLDPLVHVHLGVEWLCILAWFDYSYIGYHDLAAAHYSAHYVVFMPVPCVACIMLYARPIMLLVAIVPIMVLHQRGLHAEHHP